MRQPSPPPRTPKLRWSSCGRACEPVFGLPGDQDKLVEEVAAVNPNTIVVLNTSQPVALPWVDKVKAVLEMWWPGDEGGWSTANLLLGKVSPAGRLPVTWGKSLDDYPATDPKHPERSQETARPQDASTAKASTWAIAGSTRRTSSRCSPSATA